MVPIQHRVANVAQSLAKLDLGSPNSSPEGFKTSGQGGPSNREYWAYIQQQQQQQQQQWQGRQAYQNSNEYWVWRTEEQVSVKNSAAETMNCDSIIGSDEYNCLASAMEQQLSISNRWGQNTDGGSKW